MVVKVLKRDSNNESNSLLRLKLERLRDCNSILQDLAMIIAGLKDNRSLIQFNVPTGNIQFID